MKSSQLQSLSRRVKTALAAIHFEIRIEVAKLTLDEEFNKPTYSQLSRLQRERKKLEAIQLELKQDLKAAYCLESAARVLRASNWTGDIAMIDLKHTRDI